MNNGVDIKTLTKKLLKKSQNPPEREQSTETKVSVME